MKITKIPASRTGIFVILCFGLLVIALFLIGDKKKLFSNTNTYYVKFLDVNGLKQGAEVIMTGINVGSVKTIDLPKRAGDSVLVEIHVEKDAGKLIHIDSKAMVTTIGLVGDKTVSIKVGSVGSPVLPPGGLIIGESQRELSGLLDTLGEALNAVRNITEQANGIVGDIHSGKGTLGKLISDSSLYKNIQAFVTSSDRSITQVTKTAEAIQRSIDSALGNFSQTSTEFKKVGENLNKGKGSLGKLLNDTTFYAKLSGVSESISRTVAELRDAMVKISTASGNTVEVTEAMKHNFLVKGYFEDRGYWRADVAEQNIQTKIDSLQKIQANIDEKLKLLKNNP